MGRGRIEDGEGGGRIEDGEGIEGSRMGRGRIEGEGLSKRWAIPELVRQASVGGVITQSHCSGSLPKSHSNAVSTQP